MIDETAKAARLMKVVEVMVAELDRQGLAEALGQYWLRPDAIGQGGHQGSGRGRDRLRQPPRCKMIEREALATLDRRWA
jgi:hypothetical protein